MEVKYEVYGKDVTEYFTCNQFPAGEAFIKLKKCVDFSDIRNRDVFFVEKYNIARDFLMTISQKVDILRRHHCNKISVVIPYLPYSRQDRYTTEYDSFALKAFAKYLNVLNLYRVYTVDAHSDVSGVIDNLIDFSIKPVIEKIVMEEERILNVLSPDAGAAKKIYKNIDNNENIRRIVNKYYSAEKIRSVVSGEIKGIKINGTMEVYPTLIIDDICDGGRTFTSLSDLLEGEKILYVTHGIFSKDDVFNKFQKVYTTDSYSSDFEHKAKIIKLKFEEYLTPSRRAGFSS